jgi:hypothetical protein
MINTVCFKRQLTNKRERTWVSVVGVYFSDEVNLRRHHLSSGAGAGLHLPSSIMSSRSFFSLRSSRPRRRGDGGLPGNTGAGGTGGSGTNGRRMEARSLLIS